MWLSWCLGRWAKALWLTKNMVRGRSSSLVWKEPFDFFRGGPHFTSQIFCCGSSFSSLSMPRGGIRIVHCHYALRHSELLSRAGDMKLSTVHENDLILKFIQINQTNLPNGIFTHFTKKKCQKAHRVCLKKCHWSTKISTSQPHQWWNEVMFIESGVAFWKEAPPLAQNIGSDKLPHVFFARSDRQTPRGNPKVVTWRTHEHERVMHPNTSVSSENRKKYRGSKKSQTAPNLEF